MTTDPGENPGTPAVSVVLPASNEAALIGRCLRALRGSRFDQTVQVVVIANGCHDETAARARAEAPGFAARGWCLQVIDRAQGGKLGALGVGDAAARAGIRIYLDADVTVSPDLIAQLYGALDRPGARYASGRVRITGVGAMSRAYARFWAQVPFMRQGVPGCGVFAVNAAGRARWGDWPAIISDDTFARLCFAPAERLGVCAPYDWPIATGLRNLVRVRRRQDAGVAEIEQRYPDLLCNDDKPGFPASEKLRLALRDPLGFAVYSGVALAVRLRPAGAGWSRGR
ncbi:glycosyl transferase [Salipiger aestuarii]|uniref:Glycosyl transferase family 2 n=1 Tax=Salipiger aestuarii TaxID=568098 RepID=A0A327YJS7_9RHOB|nr:glycosyltransferase [Salipiger aestuarii]KAB2539496.1 glycosyl transferase [Salipiger aestuarii]RAK20015.1 glycosyl transferase family 2 [Salipiger aestuarii]